MIKIGMLLAPGFSTMSLAAVSVFELANIKAEERLYGIRLLSERGGSVTSAIGVQTSTQALGRPNFDTLIVTNPHRPLPSSPELLRYLQRAARSCRRVAAICTGAFVLAEAGLLDGRRATTHWIHARALARRFPGVRVEDDRIFIIDGAVWTSAGMSAGIDLALAMLEKDYGADLARSVARSLVVYHRRAGGQSQHSALLELDAKSDRIQSALAFAKRNLRASLSVDELAEVAHLSPRQFSRAFRAETGQSPAKAVEHLRVEAARLMIEQSRHPIEIIAREAGFADSERMRRAFLRTFGQPPQALRRNARTQPATRAA
ncbi:MAG: GlxA family transcriptional regulator [Sinimarinibacterium flocculans]|uniref:GlxA family transcriptional regulator n=1 Tax=Sinimarinibacterium flocculans TaxID=985250 RepID=UPI003C36F00F